MTITAPYNFVPLPEKVVLAPADWVETTSHDIPLENGLCGSIGYTLTAHSPILVGGQRGENNAVHFFKTPDGRYAIPGSSLRGMIRSVLEIATFGKFQQVDDKRFGYRDLSSSSLGKYYKEAMVKQDTHTGWLEFSHGEWRLTPCKMARISHSQLKDLDRDWQPPKKLPCSAGPMYKSWRQGLSISFKTVDEKQRVRDISLSNVDGYTTGTLVFTGLPNMKKAKEFVFYGEGRSAIANDSVAAAVNDLQQMMDGLDPSQRDASSWIYWKQRIEAGERAPIFFKREDKTDTISSIGMAHMYKLPFERTVHELIDEAHKTTQPDLTELMFGYIDEAEKGQHSLRARIHFDLACQSGEARADEAKATVLNSPKASYYPNYIDQNNKSQVQSHKTYDDSDARPRGWKRYPARDQLSKGIESVDNDKISTILHPLKAGTTFKGRVVFHNLRPEELGALLWALTWGGEKNLRHSLGMGRPLGYGQASFKLEEPDIRPNDPSRNINAENALQAFKDFMDDQVEELGSGWRENFTIETLLAMADFERVKNRILEHMTLDMKGRNNPFNKAKDEKRALPPYIQKTAKLKSHRKTWKAANLAYDPGSATFTVNHAEGKALSSDIDTGRAMFGELSKSQQKKAKQGQLRLDVEVEHIPGTNQFILKRLIRHG